MIQWQDLQNKVVSWRDTLEGESLEGALAHLNEEVSHLVANPYDPLHLADVFILMMGIANKVGFSMEEIALAISSKMAINESREWAPADEKGVIRHKE